jgi:hypothetical protein
LRRTSVLVVAGAAALVIVPTLVALTRGGDYRLAVMLGATLAATLAWLRWRTVPQERMLSNPDCACSVYAIRV